MFRYLAPALVALAVAAPASAGPLQITSRVLAEVPQRSPDGTMQVALRPVARATPGDRIVYELAYRNTGAQPLANIVVDNPLPAGIAYRAPASGSAALQVSVDGRRYDQLAALTVATAGGARRPATAADVTHVRWRFDQPLAPGAQGRLAFRAVLK